MLVRDYLQQSGLTTFQLAETLGHQTTASVTKKLDAEMPKRWARLLDLEDESSAVLSDSEPDARAHTTSEEKFRANDSDSTMPEDGVHVIGPQRIRLDTIEGYITQIYGGAAAICRGRGDVLASDVIEQYSPQFSEAWVDYIRSDPKIMEMLERLMIGTPLGNLIGVHVLAVGSYTFARIAANQVARAYAEAEGFTAGNETATDSLV